MGWEPSSRASLSGKGNRAKATRDLKESGLSILKATVINTI